MYARTFSLTRTPTLSLTHPFIHSFIHSLTHSLSQSPIHRSSHLLIHSPKHVHTNSHTFTLLRTYVVCSLTQTDRHARRHTRTHSLTRAHSHSLTRTYCSYSPSLALIHSTNLFTMCVTIGLLISIITQHVLTQQPLLLVLVMCQLCQLRQQQPWWL